MDFKRFPEIRNEQLGQLYLESPHRQIMGDIEAKVERVIDGDTIRVRWSERDFDFPVRLIGIDAPELDQEGGVRSAKWLADQIRGEYVLIRVDPRNRVGKWGRLLGDVIHRGLSMSLMSMALGYSIPFDQRRIHDIPEFEPETGERKWP